MSLEGLQLGQYRLLHILGSGGMGEVYLAEDSRINQQVAIKVSRMVNASDHLFKREAKAVASLDHPRILPLFGYGEECVNGVTYTYMVMPYRREGSFADWLQQHVRPGLLAPQDAAYFIQQAAEALQHAHDHQIIHQDIKPSNFLIRSNSENPLHPDLLLADFGIAKLNNGTTNQSQAVRGTPTYMAPEQWSGAPVPATDQYALAVVAYELLVGRAPFVGRQEQVMYQHFSAQPQLPSAINSRISPAVDAVLLRALDKQPADRFASITDFARSLQQALFYAQTAYVAPSLPPPPPPPSVVKTERASYLPGASPVAATVAAPDAPVYAPAQYAKAPAPLAPAYNPTQYATPPVPLANTTTPSILKPVMAFTRGAKLSRNNMILLAGVLFLLIVGSVGISALVNTAKTSATNGPITVTQPSNGHPSVTNPGTPVTHSTPTATPITTFPFSDRLVLNDSLSGQSNSHWFEGGNSVGTCNFSNGAYDAILQQSGYTFCPAQQTSFSNFSYEVQMQFISGECGGIIFRGNSQNGEAYYFHVCSNGQYAIAHLVNCSGCTVVLKTGFIANLAASQPNLIAVVARGSSLDLYLNRQRIGGVNDNALKHGQIGVAVDAGSKPAEVAFSNAKVWSL